MLTPPYHFSIVACPATSQVQDDIAAPSQILYRGSTPATRNLPFLKRLGLRTVVYCRKKELKDDDPLVRWTKKRGAELKWIKAEGMSEEKLGMGKSEVGEALKVILNPASYPLYIADLDGISHTSLVIACLRKLQGWHLDSIINEIACFEPEYEDLPLLSFINTYLTSSSDTAFALPPPPYPTWLWPTAPPGQAPAPAIPAAPSRSSNRDRTSSSVNTSPNTVLPFPHPLTARRHPTMKLTFPPAPPNSAQSPQLAAQNPNVSLSRVNSVRGPAIRSPGSGSENDHPGLVGAAANLLSNGLSRVASAVGTGMDDKSKRLSRNVSFENEAAYLDWRASITGTTSPERLSRQPTNMSSEEISEQGVEVELPDAVELAEEEEELVDEDEDEYDEDEDEDDDDEDLQPPSQYISALDLAGF